MKIRVSVMAFAAATLVAGPALASLSTQQMNRGSGLAQIIAAEDACGIKIDQKKLAAYFKSADLDNPEALNWIENMRVGATGGEKPSASRCTMIVETAKKIGIVAE